MLEKLVIGLVALGLALPALGQGKGKTKLSVSAGQLKVGTARAKVVETLGPATWVVVLEDGGPMSIKELGDVALQLLWNNGTNCFPVTVIFDAEMKLSGIDTGNCIDQALDPTWLPGAEYSCDKQDRAALCKP